MIAAAYSYAVLSYKLEPHLLAIFSESLKVATGNPVLVLQNSWQDLLVSLIGDNTIDCPTVECN